jgi:DNA-binding NarL/FixJ family response regulator
LRGTVINVLISDGRKLVREGLAMLLARHDDIRVVGEADDSRSAAKLVAPLAAEVVVVNLPQAGIMSEVPIARQIVRELVGAQPRVRVIILGMRLAPPEVRELIAAGAAGCLTKECASEELVAAVRAVAAGKVHLGALLAEEVVRRYVKPSNGSPSRPRLAPREAEVLRRIAAGQSTKEIAHVLGVGTKTVETHRRRLMGKLDRYSIAELTQYALMTGMIALPSHLVDV